jgi:hypothetical protein
MCLQIFNMLSTKSTTAFVLILTLRTTDKTTGTGTGTGTMGLKCMTRSQHIMDLAGAERLIKASNDNGNAIQAVMDYWRGKPITIGGQGFIVNYELSALRTGVVQATERHKQRKPLIVSKAMGTSFFEYTSGCFSGSSLLSMIVTLSPAPSCGWCCVVHLYRKYHKYLIKL